MRAVYLTRREAAEVGDCGRPVALRSFPGLWLLRTRPVADVHGRVGPVVVVPADELAELVDAMVPG